MGTGASHCDVYTVPAYVSKGIEEQLKKDRDTFEDTVKLLLLGPGESGKSTVLKQMRLLQKDHFTDTELIRQRSVILANVMLAMTELLNGMRSLGLSFDKSDRELDVKLVLGEQMEDDCSEHEQIAPYLAGAISRLWTDAGIQATFERANEFQLIDSAKYFLDHVQRISSESYVPSQEDILMARKRTCGIMELKFVMKETSFLVVDVGGQRSQRRKWIHYFQDVTSILYIAAVSEYNQMLREAELNRLVEAVRLFGSLANSRWFKKTQMILFLNKIDIFEEKVHKASLTSAFPDYNGPQTYESCLTYIEERFRRKNRNPQRQLYVHRTCATDSKQIHFVLDSTLDTIITNRMKAAGLC